MENRKIYESNLTKLVDSFIQLDDILLVTRNLVIDNANYFLHQTNFSESETVCYTLHYSKYRRENSFKIYNWITLIQCYLSMNTVTPLNIKLLCIEFSLKWDFALSVELPSPKHVFPSSLEASRTPIVNFREHDTKLMNYWWGESWGGWRIVDPHLCCLPSTSPFNYIPCPNHWWSKGLVA